MTFILPGEPQWIDGVPLKGVRAEHLADKLLTTGHLNNSIYGTPTGLTKTLTNTDGTAATLARSDHGHSTEQLPWGVADGDRFTANDSARAPGAATDFSLSTGLIQGRWYAFHLHTRAEFATAGDQILELVQDGTVIGIFTNINTNAANAQRAIDATIRFEATATDLTIVFTVENAAGSAGNVTLLASSTDPRTFVQLDEGTGP